jgi:phosphoglycolate phosphatase-like HAD superfamily hydrolase
MKQIIKQTMKEMNMQGQNNTDTIQGIDNIFNSSIHRLILWDWQDTLHNGQMDLPYAEKLLEYFNKLGLKQAVISNARASSIKAVVSLIGWDKYLELIVGSDLGLNLKPAPDMILYACDFFSMQPSQALFFGDSLADKSAACAAGCDFYSSALGLQDFYKNLT